MLCQVWRPLIKIANLGGMTSITISVADERTVAALTASVVELFAEDAGQFDPSVDTAWPVREGADYYAGIVNDPTCLLLIATAGDRPVGHLVGKLREPTTLQPVRFAVLESMRVAPDLRGNDVGGQLARRFLGWARESGAQVASVTAYAANAGAQRFYGRHGFTPQSVTLRAQLAGVPS